MLCAADYPAERVEWLWPNRIPIGKVTLLVGDPGNGKSLVALDIAARVAAEEAVRGAWPDQKVESQETRAGSQKMPSGSGLSAIDSRLPGSVLILSAEDDLRDTIRPRLDAAGADPSRIFVLPSVTDLRNDLAKLRAAIDRALNCRLLIIDPVNAYVGPSDSHFHTVVRRVFQPLAQLAAEKGLAVLAVSHLRKQTGAAIQRTTGSMGFVAVARAVWTVCRDAVQTDRHLLLPLKNNLVANTDGLAYTITSANPALPLGPGQGEDNFAPTIVWQQDPVTTSAVEVLEPAKNSRGPEAAELKLAMDWLKEDLALGRKDSLFVCAEGTRGGGFSESTLRSALVALGGRTRKLGPFGDWEWYLPAFDFPRAPKAGPAAPRRPTPNQSPPNQTLQKTWPLRENRMILHRKLGHLGKVRASEGRGHDRRWMIASPHPAAAAERLLPMAGTGGGRKRSACSSLSRAATIASCLTNII